MNTSAQRLEYPKKALWKVPPRCSTSQSAFGAKSDVRLASDPPMACVLERTGSCLTSVSHRNSFGKSPCFLD
ncbi:hypothetical protein HZH68_000682 [Vespula germanica]|uniref:Uncharacterized protein n=2 Tax=Vespula TaxID=7451 RepID=A0A834NUM2_VESGE|nr:hypothetical protein HZH68_000682 [Vespula germanica]KAF7438349.1 hypothetical protein H0235_000740 [Vespula pensylvanica]